MPLKHFNIPRISTKPDPGGLRTLIDLTSAGQLHVRIAETVPFTNARDALHKVETGSAAGKIVINVG